MTLEHFTFGPIRATVDPETGDVVAMVDLASGMPAAALYSPGYLARVVAMAHMVAEDCERA